MGTITFFSTFLTIGWLAFKLIRFGRREDTLPPGPPTIPILGNVHLLPRKFPYLQFTKWAQEYGGVFSLKVTNGTIIVLSDMQSVKELIDERSAEMSSRPAFSGLDAVTGGKYLVTAPSETHFWKMGRKIIQPLVSPQAVQRYLPVADTETTQMLYDILHNPEAFYEHISRTTLSFITSVVFGQRTPKHDSPVAIAFREYILNFSRAFSPEAAPVDFIPALMYIPDRWAPWKKLWKKTKALQRSLYFGLIGGIAKSENNGVEEDCFVLKMMERREELGLDDEDIAYISGVLLDGGSDTTSAFLKNFILCLVKSPACLRKAQEEVDKAVGQRLPVAHDFQSMPYVQAIVKETHRFLPVAATAVPHASVNDCEYRGYVIPSKTPILVNAFGILRDPNVFERPDEFWPERYLLTPDGTKPGFSEGTGNMRSTLHFGSGKRLCPGMHLANTNLSLAIMRLIWAFDFNPPNESDEQSQKWDIETEFIDGITLTPKPFQCKMTVRSEEKMVVIEEVYKRIAVTE